MVLSPSYRVINFISVMKIVVIGAGLIGTSIALGAKRAGAEVELFDEDGRAQNLANDLVLSSKIDNPTIVVIATPTSAEEPTAHASASPRRRTGT